MHSSGPKAPASARSHGFSGTDEQYAELYDAPCTVAADCTAPCTERGGSEEFCVDSICIDSEPDYCLPPTKWRGVSGALAEGASIDDAAVTSLSTSNGTEHDRLVVDDFGFEIPEGATIEGITAVIRHAGGGPTECSDQRVRIVKGAAISEEPREKQGYWPVDLTNETYGGQTDLWGETWTPADINSAEFGLAIAALPGDYGGRAYVDIAYLEVHYSLCVE